ncbi:MAG: hypothetical protein CR975_04205 [Gammaproteobacteria bacterium]|nr:MAG: hypothetical protein CR975_04205 [Gammaproteobacteria bacterium]
MNSRFPCPLCDDQESTFYFTDSKNYQHTYHRCRHCDLVFVIPACRLDREAEKARYEMHHNDNSDDYVRFLSRLAKPTLQYLPPHSHGLDFGSGKSQAMADLFRRAGHQCDCYDLFYYADTTLLQRQYDFILASEVIEHLYQPKMVFEQWLSLLKTNGILAIMTGFRPADKDFPNWWYKNDPTHVSLFSSKTFAYLQTTYQLQRLCTEKNIVLFKQS